MIEKQIAKFKIKWAIYTPNLWIILKHLR